MAVRRGISIVDLIPETAAFGGFIPDSILEQIGVLTVLDHRSTTSTDFFLHEGTLQSLADALNLDTREWVVRVPGLTHGLPFRFSVRRVPALDARQEGAPALWTLDIQIWDVEVLIPGVRGARQIGGSGTSPLHLEPVKGNEIDRRVFLVARGVLRISGGGTAGTKVQLVDAPDPFDPTAPTGEVLRLTARPPHFLFGDSQFGMTLDRFVIDLSRSFTPAEVVARGHDEAWEGVAFREATFYLPPDTPVVRSLSVGARDVIAGDPGGLQGEIRIEFGQDFADQFNTHVRILQQNGSGDDTPVSETTPEPRGTTLQFAVSSDADGRPRRVKAVFGVGDSIPGHSNLGIVGVWWRLPNGAEGTSATTPYFDAPTEGELRYRLRVGDPAATAGSTSRPSELPTGHTELAEVTVRFPRTPGEGTGANPPLVDAIVDSTTFQNVLHLRGPRERLAGVTLATRGGVPGRWSVGGGSAPAGSAATPSFALPTFAEGTTSADVTLQTSDGVRRVRIEVLRTGPLTVGHQESSASASAGVVTVVGTGQATPTRVLETFRAAPFHARADRVSVGAETTISGSRVSVPQGTIVEVEVPVPAGANDPLPPLPQGASTVVTAVQVLFRFSSADPERVVVPHEGEGAEREASLHVDMARPIALGTRSRASFSGSLDAALRAWIGRLPAAGRRTYYLVARTDDLWFNVNAADNRVENDRLARSRLSRVQATLGGIVGTSDTILSRIETEAFASAPPGALAPARIRNVGRLALPDGQADSGPGGRPVWNRSWTRDGSTSDAHRVAADDANREGYRCVEIWVHDEAAPPPEPPAPSSDQGVPTSVLVPGPDGTPPPSVPSSTTGAPPTDYRVRLRARWDSPTLVTLADAIPTEAEALVAWKAATTELPATASGRGTTLPAPTGQSHWEIVLHWTYDARTGQTEATGSLSLPDGAVKWTSDALAGALAFGPAFAALLDSSDVVSDPAGEFVLAAALIGAGAVVGEIINTGSGPDGTTEIDKVTISYRWNGDSRVSATLDYTVDLRVNVSLAGSTLVGRLKLKYKNVGLRFDWNDGGLQGLALTYDDLSVEVVDPGTWSLGGALGNLIRIASSRIGSGSSWMEFDLEFAVDLGVIRLEGATIRLVISPFSVELRGLTAKVNIDGVLEGRGSVTVGDAGAFRALLALQIIPAKLGAYGSLAVDQDFVAVEVGVQLPVGLPLGATGLGLFGLMGRFVANGARSLEGLNNPDPVQRELDWYVRSPDQKYGRKPGQFALGLGAVIGTLPDSGFTFNAEGSVAIGFPDVSVVFGIDAKLATERKFAATESGTPSATTFRILGLALFEPEAVMIAVRANFEIPKVLKLHIPLSAYFPLQGSGNAFFIRIGTDNHPTRPGSPVTLVLLPEILNVRVWAFVMIEERELLGLGGSLVPLDLADPLDFYGFSIGMGAGFELKFEAGPFKLEIVAFMLVGLGTKPLLFAGVVGIRGELDLVIIGVCIDGLIHFHVSPGFSYLEGHFCGRISLFFFTISACIDLRIGDAPPSDIPEPESPIVDIDLCDHLAAVKGTASRTATEGVPTVWPDTIAVVKFSHYVEDGLGAAADFVRRVAPSAALSPWSGSTELKYAFRLKTVELHKLAGLDPNDDGAWAKVSGPFDSAWWLPTHRRALIAGGDTRPSSEEGRELGLFHWDPRAWSRWLGEGSEDLPADPANTVEELCNTPQAAEPSCAFGQDAEASPEALAKFAARPRPGASFPSRFDVRSRLAGDLSAAVIAPLASDAGWFFVPGSISRLDTPATLHGAALTNGWRLPSLRTATGFVGTIGTSFSFSRALESGELVFELCMENRVAPIEQQEVCDSMPAERSNVSGFVGRSGAEYRGSFMATMFAGEPAAVVNEGVLRAELPATAPTASRVAITLIPDTNVRITFLDPSGRQLHQIVASGPNRQIVSFASPGIRAVEIGPLSGSKATVFSVCWSRASTSPLATLLVRSPIVPLLTLHGADGTTRQVQPLPTAPPVRPMPITFATVVSAAQPLCQKVVYRMPPGAWVRAELGHWRRGTITLIAGCGVTREAVDARAQDQNFRASLAELLRQLIASGATNQATHSVYLERNSTYQVRMAWQYQGFRPQNTGDQPNPPQPSDWKDASSVERFTFKTAELGTVAAPRPAATSSLAADPAQGGPAYDERVFDPRGVARFVTRAVPHHEDPPHFLGDRVGFWFMADHCEPLVDRYESTLAVKVLHTDPRPGSLHGVPEQVPGTKHTLDVTKATDKRIETLTWFEADHRLVTAALAAPCLGGAPALGSASVSVTADLKPQAEYDLLLNVAPKEVGGRREVVVARSHFRTSRYENPAALLLALGFEPAAGAHAPNDAIATGSLPAAALEVGDAAMDVALTALGLDPWPLPDDPRCTVIWTRPSGGTTWAICALLLEADEPIWRAGLRTGALGEAGPPPRCEIASVSVRRTFERLVLDPFPPALRRRKVTAALGTLAERVRSSAGTRILFTPAAPILMRDGHTYDIELSLREDGAAGAIGRIRVFDRPLIVFQEGE